MTLLVDFMHPELCVQTRPVNCSINGRAIVFVKRLKLVTLWNMI